ncbi:hypothetical protein [Natronosalvus rutilus]|uniref:Uncharacterized protein n=1 Tax=Natronosalvus rutilus TaxID=2953753 RepID=A0A9E7NAK3_9EURY|nr:hypothetical protein [Natronosalvus rutilus]UTF53408.1 hypothetical protein NGM29_16820 [Natronosalvus rutilus]
MVLENRRSLTAAQIAGIYAVVSGLWVVLTDRILETLFPTIAAMAVAQTAKGLVFILPSTAIIYALVARSRRELEARGPDSSASGPDSSRCPNPVTRTL